MGRRGRRRGRRSRVKTTDEDRKTLSKSVAGAGCTDPTFGETASEPEETITSQNALETTTKPISVPVPQGISEEIVKLVKDRIDFLEAVEAAKCSTWYRQIMEIIQKSKNPQKKSKKTKHQKKNKNPQVKKKKILKKTNKKKVTKTITQDNVMKPEQVDKKKENIQDHESIVHGIVDEIISNAIEEAETSEASAGVSGSRRRRMRRGRGGRGQRGSRRQRGASGGRRRRRRRGRRSRVKTTDEDRKTLSKSVAGAGCTDPTFGETAAEPEETITPQNAPEPLATTTKPISVPVPQGFSEEIVKLVKDRIDFLEAVEAAKCSTWYRQIMEIIQKSKNPPKKSKKTKS